MARSVPRMQCYIWEWQRDDGGFSPYPADVVQLLEDQFTKRSPSFDLQLLPNYVKSRHPRLQENVVDFAAMEQVHKESGYRSHVKRRLIHLPPTSPPCGGEWFWEMAYGMFVLYDFVSMLVIEEAYQSRSVHGGQAVDLSRTPANLPYTISFQPMGGYMFQTRHGFNTQRRVQRLPLDQPLQACLFGTAQGQPSEVSPLAAALGPVHPHLRTAHHYAPLPTPPATSVGGAYHGNSASNSMGGGAYHGSSASNSMGGGAYHGSSVSNSTGGGAYHGSSASNSMGGGAYHGSSVSNSTGGGAYHGSSASNSTGGGAYHGSSASNSMGGGAYHGSSVSNSTGGGAYHGSSASNSTGGGACSLGSSLLSTTGGGPQSVFEAAAQPPLANSEVTWQDNGEGSSSAHCEQEVLGLANPPQRILYAGPRVPPLDPAMASYVSTVRELTADEDEPCPVCLCKLSEASDYQSEDLGLDLVQLLKCSHRLHRLCFQHYFASQTSRDSPSGIRCPTCKKIHGVKVGDMPKEYGSMHVRRTPYSLPGYEGHGCIEITYSFRPGRDRNGRQFFTHGFPRVCYLPDCPKGQRVMRLLQVAWDRRLTFTIGTSVTTGARNTLVWNEIHHKTECHGNTSGHGYPDPNYLDNVLMELESQGVTEDDQD